MDGSTTDGSPTTGGMGEGVDSSEGDPSDSSGATAPECVDVAFDLHFDGAASSWMDCIPGESVHTSTEEGVPLTTIELECVDFEAELGAPSSMVVARLEGYAIELGPEPVELGSVEYWAPAVPGFVRSLRRDGRLLALSSDHSEWSIGVDDVRMFSAWDDECSFGDRTEPPNGLEGVGPSGEVVRETTWAVVSVMEKGHEMLARVSGFVGDAENGPFQTVMLDRALVVR